MNREPLTFRRAFLRGALLYNPVLVQLVGLCPAVAATASVGNAVLFSAALLADLIVTCVLASALMKRLPRAVRVVLYFAVGLGLLCPLLYFIEQKTLMDLGLSFRFYLPLLAVNAVTAVHCEQFSVKNTVRAAFLDAAACGIGASLVFLIVGTLREVLGSGTFAGMELGFPVTLRGLSLPFGCFLLLGFLAAGLRAASPYLRRYVAQEEREALEAQEAQAAFEAEATPAAQPQPAVAELWEELLNTEPEALPPDFFGGEEERP